MINAEYGKPALVRFENHLDENPHEPGPPGLRLPGLVLPDPPAQRSHRARERRQPALLDGGRAAARGLPAGAVGRPPVPELAGRWDSTRRSRASSGSTTTGWTTPARTSTRAWSACTRSTTRRTVWTWATRRQGLRLPGVRTDNPDGSFDVKYDIPLAFFDARLDDGVTIHKDIHDGLGEFPDAGNPRTHPEWWGKTFYKHFPNHGFVGDIFTVNGTASPVLNVDRRKYRFRFLDASIARIYEFKLMSSTQGPKSAVSLGYGGDELQGQYRIEDGQQCMKFTQIATDGGLLPFPLTRDSFELWPAKRREFIVDFTRYQDGTPTTKGDVIYLTNIMKMANGRKLDNSTRFGLDPKYKVPVLKFVIGDNAPDNSEIPAPTKLLRPLPPLPANWRSMLDNRLIFEVQRGSAGGEIEWLDQRRGLRPSRGGDEQEEPGRELAAGPAEEGQLQPLGDPQRRRRLGAPVPPAHGGAPHRHAQRQGRDPVSQIPGIPTTSRGKTWRRSTRVSR